MGQEIHYFFVNYIWITLFPQLYFALHYCVFDWYTKDKGFYSLCLSAPLDLCVAELNGAIQSWWISTPRPPLKARYTKETHHLSHCHVRDSLREMRGTTLIFFSRRGPTSSIIAIRLQPSRTRLSNQSQKAWIHGHLTKHSWPNLKFCHPRRWKLFLRKFNFLC